jgi:hypothetical protein
MAVRPTHLAKRFFGMLVPLGPKQADERWACAQLLPGEVALWERMKRADRRHAAGVARRVDHALGDDATRPVLAAALLHDVGKIEANFGPYRRVVATLSAMAVRHDPDVIRAWTRTTGFTRRVGLYLQHPKLGGDLLGMAGSDPLTEQWARQHHSPEEDWTVPLDIGLALKAADDD